MEHAATQGQEVSNARFDGLVSHMGLRFLLAHAMEDFQRMTTGLKSNPNSYQLSSSVPVSLAFLDWSMAQHDV